MAAPDDTIHAYMDSTQIVVYEAEETTPGDDAWLDAMLAEHRVILSAAALITDGPLKGWRDWVINK
jgi:hypothetical protein